MPRGPAKEAKNQLNTTNQAAAGYGQNAASAFGTLMPQAQSLVGSTGYDPATLGAITNAGMGGVNAAFGDAGNQITRQAARTGNPAGVGGQLDALARSKGLASGQEAGNIQIQNADFANNQRMAGLNLLNSMYGTSGGLEEGLYGQGVPAINAQTAASPGWVQNMTGILSALGGLGGGVGAAAKGIGGGG